MRGHLQHTTPTMLPVHVAADIALGVIFGGASFLAFHSNIRHPIVFYMLLALIYVDHVLLANGGGYFFILIDVPMMLFISFRCFKRWREAKEELLAT